MITDVGLCCYAVSSYKSKPTVRFEDVSASVTPIGKDEVVVAFPGTDSVMNWVRDLDFVPGDFGSDIGPLHEGFGKGALGLWTQLRPMLASKRVWFTGHSLGGALALIVAAFAKEEQFVAEAVVTFGAPRAGTVRLREWMTVLAVRQYRHRDDMVPEVPPEFCHVRLPLVVLGNVEDPIQAFNIQGNHNAATAYLEWMMKTYNATMAKPLMGA